MRLLGALRTGWRVWFSSIILLFFLVSESFWPFAYLWIIEGLYWECNNTCGIDVPASSFFLVAAAASLWRFSSWRRNVSSSLVRPGGPFALALGLEGFPAATSSPLGRFLVDLRGRGDGELSSFSSSDWMGVLNLLLRRRPAIDR